MTLLLSWHKPKKPLEFAWRTRAGETVKAAFQTSPNAFAQALGPSPTITGDNADPGDLAAIFQSA